MARKRMIHPDFFTSATLNALPIPTMTTFAGTLCYVDDYGRGENDEALVKAAVWPRRRSMGEKKVREALDELVESDVLCAYVIAGHSLFHVVSWREHQSVSHPTPSKLPPCPNHEPEAWEEFMNDSDPSREKFRSGSGATRERLRNVS